MELKVEMILARLSLEDVPMHVKQVPLPPTVDLEEMEILSPPAVLLHQNLTEFLTNVPRLISWRTTSRRSNLSLMIGQLECHFLLPASHLRPSCVECGIPLHIYSAWIEVTIDGKEYGKCPACHLRHLWVEEGRAQKETFEESERAYTRMKNILTRTAGTVAPSNPSWYEVRETMARDYAKDREEAFLKKWTSQDVAWWTSEKQKSLDAARKKLDSSTSAS